MSKKIKKAKPAAKKTAPKKTAKAVKKIVKPAKKAAPKKTKKVTVKKVIKTAQKKAAAAKKTVRKDIKKMTNKATKIKTQVTKKAAAAQKTAAKNVKKTVKKVEKQVKKAEKNIKKTVTQNIKKAETVKNNFLAKAAALSAKAEALTAAEIKEIKQTLLEMRDDALARLKEKKEMEMPDTSSGDPIDVATQSLDKELLFEQTDNSQTTVDQIESALRKIDKGIYGSCESCRALLPKKRIKALPFARYCVVCQSSREGR